MWTTFDGLSFSDVGEILRPHLDGRRVFLSACEMTTAELADELIGASGCFSVIGPAVSVGFGDAALLWASFYHLMFGTNERAMKRPVVESHLQGTVNLFGVRMNYFSASRAEGVRHEVFNPPRT
jgi:hypothetical protein